MSDGDRCYGKIIGSREGTRKCRTGCVILNTVDGKVSFTKVTFAYPLEGYMGASFVDTCGKGDLIRGSQEWRGGQHGRS